jgi:hypothetical protein
MRVEGTTTTTQSQGETQRGKDRVRNIIRLQEGVVQEPARRPRGRSKRLGPITGQSGALRRREKNARYGRPPIALRRAASMFNETETHELLVIHSRDGGVRLLLRPKLSTRKTECRQLGRVEGQTWKKAETGEVQSVAQRDANGQDEGGREHAKTGNRVGISHSRSRIRL